ncbi:unnamed protein product [Albugo candida]|uniref:Uncharacterized protein n=1 Tax=Albugo candida TaxID=65357 RepID=A0A024GN82_9STRA|nr:unnamed protein product [Albugo candida]|eukprot:CCI48343.1 unnamed protein product [Albugo candida]
MKCSEKSLYYNINQLRISSLSFNWKTHYRGGHHVGSDGRHVKPHILKLLMPLHIHVVMLTNKANAKYILLLFLPPLHEQQFEYIQQVMSPKNVSSAQLVKLHPLLCSIVRIRQMTKNWKKSRQCPRRYWSRCSPCLVTCRCRMEFSRAGQAQQHRKEPAESSTFVSVLGSAAVYPGMRTSGPSYYQPGHPKAHRILANEIGTASFRRKETHSIVDLVVGLLDGEKNFCDKLVSP